MDEQHEGTDAETPDEATKEVAASWSATPTAGDEHGLTEPLVPSSTTASDADGAPVAGETVGASGDSTGEVPPPVGIGPMPLSMPPFSPPVATPAERFGAASGGAAGPPPWVNPMFASFPPPPPPPVADNSTRRLVAVALVAALVAGGIGAGLGVSLTGNSPARSTGASTRIPVIPTPKHPTQVGSGPTESTAAIAKAAIPAIVDINTTVASETAEGQEDAAGTGMIITASGEVLTNNHVVMDATKISVSVQGHSGSYVATVIGVNPLHDVALLQLTGVSGPLPTINLGNSSTAAIGDNVVAIGNAQGLDQTPTTVTGTVSALTQSISADDSATGRSEDLHGLIETDAPIEPGDSGGPLLDSHGVVIGMDTAASTSSDSGATLGFAIPINQARSIVRSIERGDSTGGNVLGLTPFLGIFEEPTGDGGFVFGGSQGASGSGVAVSDVAIGGPAQSAGIVGGDTITKINSTTTPTIVDLEHVIDHLQPGDSVTVTYVDTSDETHTTTVTLAGIPK